MAETAYFQNICGASGRWFLTKLKRPLDRLAFFWVCLKVMVRHRSLGRRVQAKILVQQIYFTGVQSVELVLFFSLLLGAVAVVWGYTLLSSIGAQDALASFLIGTLIREVGPILTAIIVILRSGSAIALEIGYMNVLGEIDGLRMQGVPALHFLTVPRLFGVAAAVICLIIIFELTAVAGGIFAAWTLVDINILDLLNELAIAIKSTDFMVVLAKGLCFGLIIPIVCMCEGFMAQEAITSIPPRVSRALVDSLLYCVFASVLISAVYSS